MNFGLVQKKRTWLSLMMAAMKHSFFIASPNFIMDQFSIPVQRKDDLGDQNHRIAE